MSNTSLHQFPQDVTAQRAVEGRPVRLFSGPVLLSNPPSHGDWVERNFAKTVSVRRTTRQVAKQGFEAERLRQNFLVSRMDRGQPLRALATWLKKVLRHGR